MRHLIAHAAAVLIAATATATLSAGVATADSSNPTVGDSIVYAWWSDVSDNESSHWFDGDNDIASFTSTHLPTWKPRWQQYTGVQRVTSRSTTQLVGSSFQTGGYYAECFITVNGVQVAHDVATGRYAVAVC